MSSKRDLVEAHSFNRRRLVTAFVSGSPGGREVEPVRHGRTLVGGAVLAGMVLVGAAVSGYLRPAVPDSWLDKGLVVSKSSGSRFVAFEGVLYPVINTTSARLILSQDGEMPVTFVPDDRIAAEEQGPTIGIPGAPDTLPEPEELIGSGWIACTGPDQGIDVTVRDGDAVAADPDGALLVESEGIEYVVTGGHRYPVPTDVDRAPTLRALGLDGAPARQVPGLWLDLFAEGDPLEAFVVPDQGEPVETGVPGLDSVGQPLLIDGRPYVLLSETELMALPEFAYTMYRSAGQGATLPEVELSSTQVTELQSVTTPQRRPYPDTWPEADVTTYDEPETPCVRLTADDGEEPYAELALARTDSVLPESPDVTRDVTVGTGAVVRAWNGGSLTAGTAFLIDPTGSSYALGEPDTEAATMAALGYAGVTPVPVPVAWIDLFTDGPLLSPEAASQSPDSGASLGDSTDPTEDSAETSAGTGPSESP